MSVLSLSPRTRLVLVAVALLIGSAVYTTTWTLRRADDTSRHRQATAQRLLTSMLDQETGVRGFLLTGRREFLAPYVTGRRSYAAALRDARHTGGEPALLARTEALARDWRVAAQGAVAERLRAGRTPGVAALRERKAAMDRFRAAQAALQDGVEADRRHAAGVTSLVSTAVSLVIALLVGLLGGGYVTRRENAERRRMAAERSFRSTQGEFAETMQVVQNEGEAHRLLKRHLERRIDTAKVVVLNRNNSADRLEPTTRVDEPELAERLEGAEPRSCLAVRLARPYERGAGEEPLLSCELCGKTAEAVRCKPLLVGGEVIGSVLVTHHAPFREEDRTRLAESVATAAPVLANLRNLAIAENRAATDALTGLANRRAIEDTLKRMVAQASRSVQPLSAIMLDLDHFKRLNDVHGHERGDEALAAVGALLRDLVRESDFAGRLGGEEFLVLAPGTDAAGAATLAESLRAAIAALRLSDPEVRVSASLGVASFPEAAVDGAGLLRLADRALYAAKERGRDRVEVAALPVRA